MRRESHAASKCDSALSSRAAANNSATCASDIAYRSKNQ